MSVLAYRDLLPRLDAVEREVTTTRAVLGFDGTVDVICHPVEARRGADYQAFRTMAGFGQRIVEADGKSGIVELVEQQRKIGGNGPIMANALVASGVAVDYIGTVDDPAYDELAKRMIMHSLGGPAVTHALEFPNGKMMLAEMSSYQAMDAGTLRERVGEEAMVGLIGEARLVGLLNWACLPGFGDILGWLLDHVLPSIPADAGRVFFFDLADPSMRSADEFAAILAAIARFQRHGQVVLGMNLNETQQVARVLGVAAPDEERERLLASLAAIREQLGIAQVMCHGTAVAACVGSSGCWAVDGPYTPKPKITTGAGDHLNAGFCLGLVGGLAIRDALALGVLYSGYYVRNAQPPRLADIPGFVESLASE